MSGVETDELRARYGPLAGDRIRVGDTDLWICVAEDRQPRPTVRSGGMRRASARA